MAKRAAAYTHAQLAVFEHLAVLVAERRHDELELVLRLGQVGRQLMSKKRA